MANHGASVAVSLAAIKSGCAHFRVRRLFVRPIDAALRATRSMRCAHQACSLGPSGDDREQSENERDFQRSHSFPLRSLRVRRFWADPLALLPLSLPGGLRTRLRFDWRRSAIGATAWSSLCLPPHRPPASHLARGPFPVWPLRGDVLPMMFD
jgi:hypothetical protein